MTNSNSSNPLVVVLKKGREKPVRMGNPWIFSGAIANVNRKGRPGDLCQVQQGDGVVLGWGYYNKKSSITVRMLSLLDAPFTTEELHGRIAKAIERRQLILDRHTDSCRLVNSEGDFLPGLIVDKVGNGLVIQVLTWGMERFRNEIISELLACCAPLFIYERSDSEARQKEGLTETEGPLEGEAPRQIEIFENGLSYVVDVTTGQKTGYFFDQRQNRLLLRNYVAGKAVCDCFSYSGGFATNALKADAARVDVVDISSSAVEWAKQNISRNFEGDHRTEFVCADVFRFLRETPKTYDCIICDPPKFAKHQGEVKRAARGYKDINLCAFKKLNKGGILFTFSCSRAVDSKLFRQIVFAAAADSGRQIQLLHTLGAGPDHPVNIAHMEGEYLKGLVLRVVA
ncbi:MAG: class I SAM-dependent rRNA methyltransferase [Deltaproteobacteria bacterium]|nr:class I SAM-dependent rRNA methyltransferase [Deltaproteobacteria bacterium]